MRPIERAFRQLGEQIKNIKQFGLEGDYARRAVAHYEKRRVVVSTVKVYEGKQPYETAVKHPLYSKRDWIVVEAYSGLKEASDGHNKWVKILTTSPLPDQLVDCKNSLFAVGDMIYPKKKVR